MLRGRKEEHCVSHVELPILGTSMCLLYWSSKWAKFVAWCRDHLGITVYLGDSNAKKVEKVGGIQKVRRVLVQFKNLHGHPDIYVGISTIGKTRGEG